MSCGQNMASGPSSEWPLGLVMDEVWLKTRRLLVQALEGLGCWLPGRAHSEIIQAERRRGNNLAQRVLPTVLGEDYDLLRSEALFGPLNQRFRRKLPMALSFGASLANYFEALQGQGAVDRQSTIADLCGIFNLGISIFDVVVDEDPRLAQTLLQVFDAATLDRLIASDDSSIGLRSRGDTIPAAEVRILLRIIAWVFAELHALEGLDGRRRIALHLRDAYRAERATAVAGALPRQIDMVRTKSTLPIVIISELALMKSGPSEAVETVIHAVAETFWPVDDLADLVRDFRKGHVNSILLADPCDGPATPASQVLCRILDGPQLPQIVSKIYDSMRTCERFAADNQGAGRQFLQFLLAYVRDWLQ